MLNPEELRFFVIRPALLRIDLWSRSAENIVLGTWIVESGLREIDQGSDLVPGPAYGLGQMEFPTYQDHWENFLVYNEKLFRAIKGLTPWATRPPIEELYGNLFFCAAMTRIHYRRVPEPLPASTDFQEMAGYWKLYYNTPKGKGDAKDPRVLNSFKQACLA